VNSVQKTVPEYSNVLLFIACLPLLFQLFAIVRLLVADTFDGKL